MSIVSQRRPVISSQSFAVFVFVFVELMFFSALFSSYLVIKRGRVNWDVPGNIHLPVLAGGFNTVVLLLSGLFLYWSIKALEAGAPYPKVRNHILRAALLGASFVAFQLFWVLKLMSLGLKMSSNIFGACYFLMIGAHGLHAFLGTLAMVILFLRSRQGIELGSLKAFGIFWFFVVGVWPFLYAQLYF